VETIQNRTKALLERTEVAVTDLIDALKAAKEQGPSTAPLNATHALHRKAADDQSPRI
jgi:hypothetical protein